MKDSLFDLFLSGEEKQIFPGSGLWNLPLSGKQFGKSSDSPISIGDYFLAACRFLSDNDFAILKTGLELVLEKSVAFGQVRGVSLFLEKHGAFYHPLKIQIVLEENISCLFVLNGAVSKQGLSLIKNEYQLISGMNKAHLKTYLPRVFGVDFIKTDKGKIGFFLGEWFDGYKEFHLTQDQGKRQVVIWESDGSCHYISEEDAAPIYQEISRILTYYYDLETFEHISSWHHAAGDFIVRPEDKNFPVRLITIRQYSPSTEFAANGKEDKANILPSLLFFFLNLTLRMRFDRLNGTGPVVMLGEKMIPGVVEGFLSSLDEKTPEYEYGNLRESFIEFFLQFNLEQLIEIVGNILESSKADSVETALMLETLGSHCKILDSIFKNF